MAALNRGACLPAWQYLMDIMATHGLDVIIGPSVFEAPPYTLWCTNAENFEWEAGQHPLILLDWVPTELRSTLLERARDGGAFVQWWKTGNKAISTCDPITIWTPSADLTLPLSDRSLDPPIPLELPVSVDFQAYFDHTPSGPYRQRPGQHVWTDGSMITVDEAQLVGAGVTGWPCYQPVRRDGCSGQGVRPGRS
eukprot:455207-Rhodomonas_salina.1